MPGGVLESILRANLERIVKQAGSVPLSSMGSIRSMGWECTIECNWERPWELTGECTSSRLGVCHRVQLGVSLRACPGVCLRAS